MLKRHLLPLTVAFAFFGTIPAYAQLFGEPPPRTIILSPGWHLNGSPVRTPSGLRLAVRNDAGVQKDMIVTPDGSISFATRPDDPARVSKPRKPKTIRIAVRPAPAPAALPPQDGASVRSASPAPQSVAPAPQKDDAKVLPAASEALSRQPARPAADASTGSIKSAPAQAPGATPTGPGYAHGVPINALD